MNLKKAALAILLVLVTITAIFADGSAVSEAEEISRRIDLIRTDLDYVWVIISAMLVFFMQAGFMSLESGMARSKNSINVAIKNLTDFVLGVIGFWVIGFGLMFGKSKWGLFGTTDFLISVENPWTAAFFMFQAVFVGTAATIDSGAVCERAKLKPYVLLSFLLSVFIYPVFGHWAWGSFLHGTDAAGNGAGWLEARGFKDFAGSSVVHSVGGWMALAGVIVVGPRIGRFAVDPESGRRGKPNKIPPGDMRFIFLGTFILFFTWFGFNCGSTLTAGADIAVIALNTTLAACFGCLTASLTSWILHPEKKIEGEMIANGVLAGLVGITAGCAYVDAASAAIIGAVAGLLVYGSSQFMARVLKLDDVVDAVSVHGVNGAWGTLAVGLFIRPELLGDLARGEQIGIQALGAGVCFLWAFLMGLLLYFLVDKLAGGVRVFREEEIMGLNIAEHGAKSSIVELASTMDQLTRTGDFSDGVEVEVEQGTEIGDLAVLFNAMIDRVRDALSQSCEQKEIAESMLAESESQKAKLLEARSELDRGREDSARERREYVEDAKGKVSRVSESIDDLKDMMGRTSEVTKDMTASFEGMADGLGKMLGSLDGIHAQLGDMNRVTDSTVRSVTVSRSAIEDLKSVTEEISTIVTFINDIASRTQVLAINSGIEAAHAGDSGKGFAVISKEVRELSGQTSKAAEDIEGKLRDIEARVGQTAEAMSGILEVVGEIEDLNRNVIAIVDENRSVSDTVRARTESTAQAVAGVSRDIAEAADEAGRLSAMGRTVEKDLDSIS